MTIEKLRAEIFPKIEGLYEDPLTTTQWIAYEQPDITISMNFFNNVWNMCTKTVLMIDFDFKEGFTLEMAFKGLQDYTKAMKKAGEELLFSCYYTDRGLHAFLANQKVDHLSDKALAIMVDLHNDKDYIGFVVIKGFCIRLSPKVQQKLAPGQTVQDMVNREFIARRVEGKRAMIGFGKPDSSVMAILDFHLELINWFTKQYRTRLRELTGTRYISEIDETKMAPPLSFIGEVKNEVIKLLSKFGLKENPGDYIINYKPQPKGFPLQALTIYTQPNIIMYYDLYGGIWSICTQDLLMVDFDVKETTATSPAFTRENALKRVEDFVESEHKEGKDRLFHIWITTNGLHAFLVNEPVHFASPEAQRILKAMSNDEQHIQFISHASHCVRVGPKVLMSKGGVPKGIDEVMHDFVAKKCMGEVCSVGYGEPNLWFTQVLSLHAEMITFITNLYKKDFSGMTNREYSRQVNDMVFAPLPKYVEKVKRRMVEVMTEMGWPIMDQTWDSNERFKPLPVNAKRYESLISNDLVISCSGETTRSIKNRSQYFVVPGNAGRCETNVYGVLGPDYPFCFYREEVASLLILTTFDILMLDFDEKDGSPKNTVVKSLERFLNSQRLLKENKRVTSSELCFKLYETDNGTHAWPISHTFTHNTAQAIRLFLETCNDKIYASFSYSNGYNVRMSPKVFTDSVNRIPRDPESLRKQFVQKPGIGGVLYVGNQDNIDPYLEEFVDLIYEVQQYALKLPNLPTRMIDNDDDLLRDVSNYYKMRFDTMKHKRNETLAKRWAINPLGCANMWKLE
jgi:hypothetical protein